MPAVRCTKSTKSLAPNTDPPFSMQEPVLGRLVRSDLPNGDVLHYEGNSGAERLVCGMYRNRNMYMKDTNGSEHFFEDGARRKLVCWNGIVYHFEGEKNFERVVRIECPNGVAYFEGGRNVERQVRFVKSDGTVEYYQGDRGKEKCVCVAWPCVENSEM